MDPKVQEALALLRQAGRLDLVKEEALAPSRPARCASAGVAAAVAACSPPRPANGAQVRVPKGRAFREASPGASGAVRGQAKRGGTARGSPRASPGEGRRRGLPAGGKLAQRSPVVRRYGPRHGAGEETGAEAPLGRGAVIVKGARGAAGRARKAHPGLIKQGVGAGEQVLGGSRARAAGGFKAPQPGVGKGSQLETVGLKEQRDPRVPVSRKWPTMLVWSSSDEEGVSGEVGDSWSGGEGASTAGTKGAPGMVYGSQGGGTSGEEEGSSGEGGDIGGEIGKVREERGEFLLPSTPDLVGQGPLDFDEEDPGEQGAALVPWEEVKAGPGAASRMASSGRRGRRRRAADASSGRCGGVGDAPPDAAAWEEQRPGPAQKGVVNAREYAGCAWCGGHGEQGGRRGSAREERMSDVSLEEGELRTSGSETEWWERQGRGVSNPVRKSLQVTHAGRRHRGGSQERIRGEEWKVQERPPLLSPVGTVQKETGGPSAAWYGETKRPDQSIHLTGM
ncbi:hypothetical protein NDU88_006168 [Pleurodeles waltl]|uniref:Uncharacterized protein n=1 Tax=Pleurodeles waltl TaxID=8319 RepID=A0AAV7WDM5_PLEWA|nr:hypothetical protein NDU88_006168 [Pleurodeles waltl]